MGIRNGRVKTQIPLHPKFIKRILEGGKIQDFGMPWPQKIIELHLYPNQGGE